MTLAAGVTVRRIITDDYEVVGDIHRYGCVHWAGHA